MGYKMSNEWRAEVLAGNTLFGRPVEDWARLDHTLRAANMTTVEAEDRLRGHRGAPDITEVFDLKNPDRLLGTLLGIKKRFPTVQGRSIEFATTLPVEEARARSWADQPPYDLVSFEFAMKQSGWNITFALHTTAHLKALQRLREFRLPGETEAHFARRWQA